MLPWRGFLFAKVQLSGCGQDRSWFLAVPSPLETMEVSGPNGVKRSRLKKKR
jgi:hypothetical protein